VSEVTIDKIAQIADQGSYMSLYDMAEEMYRAINERIIPDLVEQGVKKYKGKDFFVHIETSADPVLREGLPVPKVVGDVRLSMPIPNYEQQVYKYRSGNLDLLWVIPDMNECARVRVECLDLIPEEKHNLEWVTKFYDGTYERMSNEYNNKLKV